MELINHQVGRRLQFWSLVILPSLRIGRSHVDDGTPIAIHTDSLGKSTGTFALSHVKCIEFPSQVALHSSLPTVFAIGFHLHCLDGLSPLS